MYVFSLKRPSGKGHKLESGSEAGFATVEETPVRVSDVEERGEALGGGKVYSIDFDGSPISDWWCQVTFSGAFKGRSGHGKVVVSLLFFYFIFIFYY